MKNYFFNVYSILLARMVQPTSSALGTFFVPFQILGKRLAHDERESDGGIGADLYWFGIDADLAPTNGLFGRRAGIATIKLLACVDVNREVGTISHQIGIACVMLDKTTSQNDHAAGITLNGEVIDASDIFIDVQNKARAFVRMKVHHISDAAISKSGTEHRDFVFCRPV